MKAMGFTMKLVVVGCLCAGALAATACADGRGIPTSPGVSAAVAGVAPTAPANQAAGQAVASSVSSRSGALHVTKECSKYTGQSGSFCTITSSNVKAIEVGSRVVYATPAGPASLDSDVVLNPPGPGNNAAFGHCALDFATGIGLCTFSGGTGKFTHFQARADVSFLGGQSWGWDGSYSSGPRD